VIRDLAQDLRYGARSLRRSGGFTVMVVFTLAVGIGANAAIFSLVNAVLLRQLPVKEPERLVVLSDGLFSGITDDTTQGGRVNAYSSPLYQRLRDADGGFTGLAAQEANRTRSVVRWERSDSDEAALAATGRLVSANYFEVIGVTARRGRLFLPEDDAVGANPVVVLSHGYWQRRFGGNPAVIGARITVNGGPYTVVGVTAPAFKGARVGEETDLWVPLALQPIFQRDRPLRAERDVSWLVVFGRLRAGVSLASAEARANVTLQQYAAERPRSTARARRAYISIEPGATGASLFRQTVREPLLALTAGVGLLLLIVCLNVSHLLLARAVNRQREMSIRAALGANRGRLARQLLTEGCLLAALGGATAALFTRWFIDGLAAVAPAGGALERLLRERASDLNGAGGDPRVLWFTVALALGTAVVLGVVPAWQGARTNVQEALRGGALAVTPAGGRRLVSRILLASQVAFSLVLLVGAGLLAGTLGRLRATDKGFDEEHVLLVDLVPRFTGLDKERVLSLYDDIIRRVEALPGVRSASMALGTGRVVGAMTTRLEVTVPGTSREADAIAGTVTPGFVETMGITLVRGRTFTRADNGNAPPVAVITESLARRLFAGEEALGQRLRVDGSPEGRPDLRIVGIVKDARTTALKGEYLEMMFRPVAQAPAYLLGLQVRTAGDPMLVAARVRQAVAEADPNLPILNVRTVSSGVELLLENERLLATLSTVFGVVALFLVCIGLYGVISEWAAQRTREIGVRMALGATTGGVRWLVLRQAFAIVLAGAAVGLPAAFAVARLLKGLLYGLSPLDPRTHAAAALLLVAVAAVAAYLPARRASRVDPMIALRAE
jgi:predicted permease